MTNPHNGYDCNQTCSFMYLCLYIFSAYEMEDAAGDTDDEADYTKMDLVSFQKHLLRFPLFSQMFLSVRKMADHNSDGFLNTL